VAVRHMSGTGTESRPGSQASPGNGSLQRASHRRSIMQLGGVDFMRLRPDPVWAAAVAWGVQPVSPSETASGPGSRRRPSSTVLSSAPVFGVAVGSSMGFASCRSARMATCSGRRGPTSGARACASKQRRGDHRRPWVSLAASGPDQKLRRSLGHTNEQLCGLLFSGRRRRWRCLTGSRRTRSGAGCLADRVCRGARCRPWRLLVPPGYTSRLVAVTKAATGSSAGFAAHRLGPLATRSPPWGIAACGWALCRMAFCRVGPKKQLFELILAPESKETRGTVAKGGLLCFLTSIRARCRSNTELARCLLFLK